MPDITKEKLTEMFYYLDNFGEHKLVQKYKGEVSSDRIGRVIGAWACTLKPIDEAIESNWQLLLKLDQTLPLNSLTRVR